MAEETKDTPEVVDWQSQLRPDERGEEDGTKFVLIKGLRRLAKIKGIKKESHPIVNSLIWSTEHKGNVPFVQVSYMVEFADGQIFSDVADAHIYNLGENPIFQVFPTAIAATRAEARALRKALGIDLVSKEELAPKSSLYDTSGPIKSEQKTLIKRLMDRNKIVDASDLVSKVTTRQNVVDIEELTFEEAQAALKYLNNLGVKKNG